MHRKLASLAAALFLIAPVFARAQDAPPVRIRGTVESADATALMVKARDGTSMKITLPQQFRLSTVVAKSLDDIKPGDFIGSAAVQGKDGMLHALEVVVFPEAMRGTGEGHYPWDSAPDASMTNATVGEVVAAPAGKTLKVTYKGGAQDIIVGPDAPIVTFVPADAKMLEQGKTVFVVANKAADGALSARAVIVESNGVKPPM